MDAAVAVVPASAAIPGNRRRLAGRGVARPVHHLHGERTAATGAFGRDLLVRGGGIARRRRVLVDGDETGRDVLDAHDAGDGLVAGAGLEGVAGDREAGPAEPPPGGL